MQVRPFAYLGNLMATVLQRDITETLARLRAARQQGDPKNTATYPARLDRLLDQLQRKP